MHQYPNRLILVFLLLFIFIGLAVAEATSEKITRCVLIQPIVVRGDEGEDPARMRVVELLVDRVYAKAGIDFHFVEPIFYNDSEARDGKINLDEIVTRALEAGILRGNGRMVNMFFVNAVDGRAGPLGRGQQGGSLVFIALGQEPERGMEAFVVAHEVGHCLGLIHSVDDPEVPDDVVNLMGDGPFEERVGTDGLAPSQIDTLLKSHLVQDRIRCLEEEEARIAMVDESFEAFFSQLERREMAVFLGKRPEGDTLEACREAAKEAFQDAVLPFTREEANVVCRIAEQLEELVGEDYPLLARQPWWFIKFKSDLCGGFSHTRGPWILISERTTARIVETWKSGGDEEALHRFGPLFVHEQLHVLQRLYPGRFARLYEAVFGYEHAEVEADPWFTVRQLSNPDALSHAWIIKTAGEDGKERWYWPRTIIRDTEGLPRMGRDFMDLAFHLEKSGEEVRLVTDEEGLPRHDRLASLESFISRFPVQRGIDHPNEIAAYMFQRILIENYLQHGRSESMNPEAAEMVDRFKSWCESNFRLDREACETE